MDDLWEVSVVVGIRDTQWVMADKAIPDATFNLAGNAEGRAGDIAAALSGRFFLFEAKSQKSEFSSEWKPRKRGKKKARAKHAYEKLIKTALEIDHTQSLADQNAHNMLLRSTLCHYFAYWQHKDKNNPVELICLSPYFIETALGSLSKHPEPGKVRMAAACFDLTTKNGRIIEALSLGNAFTDSIGVRSSPNGDWFRVGLEAKEFQNYLNFLCEDSKGGTEALNLIVLSSTGFMRIAKSISDLAAIAMSLSPHPSQDPAPDIGLWLKFQGESQQVNQMPDGVLSKLHPTTTYTPSLKKPDHSKSGPT